ncbi:hypothetical protein [Sphingobacterium detergens]
MKRFFAILILGYLYYQPVCGQSKDMVVQEKGVTTDFNKGNGGISTSVHLFDLDFGDRTIPVTLNYSSSGLRYDDIYGKVGAGWSFSLEHALNRTIRGKLDEYSVLPNIDSVETLMGGTMDKLQKDDLLLNFAVKRSSSELGLGNVNEYLKLGTTTLKNWDSESDIFSFSNFSGAGKFIQLNRGRETLDTRNIQFFDAPNLKWKIENDFHPLAPFYIYDDTGVKYEYADLGFTNYAGNSMVTSQQLNTAIHPSGDSIRMEYEYIEGNELSTDKFLSILEGWGGNSSLPRIQTRVDEINPESILQGSKRLSIVETKTLKIRISYTTINNRPVISSILVTTRQSNPRTVRNITFDYTGMGGRFALLKRINITSGSGSPTNTTKAYDFYYFNENVPKVFDRDLFGYAFIDENGDNSNISRFPNEINQLQVYAGEFNDYLSPWVYGNLSAIKTNLPVSQKNTINESKTGLLWIIGESPSGLRTYFNYDLNQLQASVSLQYYYAGFRLKETYQGVSGRPAKINHRRFYYGNVANQETMNVNGNSGLVGSGRIINDYFGNKLARDNYIKQKGIVLKIPTSSGTTWEMLNKYEISTNYTSASSFLDLFSNNIFFDKIQEVQFNGSTPVRMKEYRYTDDFASQNIGELNIRNNQMKVAERGLINRRYRPDYIPLIYVGRKPLLAQENDYELYNNTWRIRKKVNYQYSTKSEAGIYQGQKTRIRQLMIRDFVKMNEPFAGNDGDKVNLYSKIGIDSFFDYNFYTLDFTGKILIGRDVVDYKYNN